MPVAAAAGDLAQLASRLRRAGCVFAEDEAHELFAAADDVAQLEAMVQRREQGFPLEHVTGRVHFAAMTLQVAEGVFVPRRRTEFLAAQVVSLAQLVSLASGCATVLDMCCGCGAVGAAVLEAVAGVAVHATDIDEAAVRCAEVNIGSRGGSVYCGDLYGSLPPELAGRIDVIAANAPYVPSAEISRMPLEAREYEPHRALDGGADGLDVVRRIAASAGQWLAPGGWLLVETSPAQSVVAVADFARCGLAARVLHDAQISGTVVLGRCMAVTADDGGWT